MKTFLEYTSGEEAIIGLLEKNGPQVSDILKRFKSQGLPTRRVEAWHYTDLRNLLKNYPVPAVDEDIESVVKTMLENVSSQFACTMLPIIDGKYRPELATTLPKKVLLTTHEHGNIDAESIYPHDIIGLLNSGLANDGLTIVVGDNAKIAEIICLANIMATHASSALRHSVKIGTGASAVFVELHQSAIENPALDNSVCSLELGEGASCVWVVDQEMSDNATRLSQLNVSLGKNASLTILSLNSGCKLVRQEINVKIAGEGADLKIRGVNLVSGGSHIDVTTKLDHLEPDTVSSETFRNVVVDDGHGVFQGQINVAKIAQRTDARMACNSLLLSDNSQFSAKPELEIFADDVQCAHGATVTDIDANQLFYLMARGIPEKRSRELLIRAFVEKTFEELEISRKITESLNARIDDWLSNRV